jgi:preprotein translocase subunit SecE
MPPGPILLRVPKQGEALAMAKNPFGFLQEVRNEGSKVTWPSRRETLITTGLVLLMIVLASVFFLFTDTIIRWVLALILGVR